MTTWNEHTEASIRAEDNITAQNGVLMLDAVGLQSQVAALATRSGASATADFVIEAEFIEGQWIFVGLFDARLQDAADSLTGPSQYGWTDIPGALRVRARRTDATGGNGAIVLTVVEA